MSAQLLHPSLWRLHGYQRIARWKSFYRKIRTPRRIVLTAIAVTLGVVWLGQAVAGILYRETAEPEQLRAWIPLGLMAYGLWHILKISTRQPSEPFEWTDAERELLAAAPLQRRQLVAYRLLSIVSSALLKALCFGLIMLPDLRLWPLGFLGMLLALTFLDLLRMNAEVIAWGVTATTLRKIRLAVLAIAAAVALSGLISALAMPTTHHGLPPAFALAVKFFTAVMALAHTLPGVIARLPFYTFSNVIVASELNLQLMGQLGLAASLVAGTAWGLMRLDGYFLARREQREQDLFPTLSAERNTDSPATGKRSTAVIIPRRRGGSGTLAWRQFLGIRHYPSTILVSMILPGVLSMLPVFTDSTGISTVIQVVGSLIFYSFLLMPAALRFDFRRDVDRLAVLKALPIGPLATTVGQLLAPVVACTVFQLVVLTATLLIRPYPPSWLAISVLLLLPVNTLIFTLENLIFLLFPYRPNQEGVGVFLRSILTFTAKGILFLLAVCLTLLWVRASHALADSSQWATPNLRLAVFFVGGLWAMITSISAILVAMIAHAYQHFDPSQDTPAA